ncbi:SDR family oxidoreductase [Gloeothece verrucosa]|uniref:Short-chain dehydrogenase/reductase SDR n=1 Tax=Gloeothece verrucosa (strain PCC 7822) TaxID=497965 RepID=E0ULV9_GLOV7|nr:SDR family oxidoreductase [Gloeothece verrucosa]ADN17939.1 short-chain dehydrogenase/reductase SDR [Gloeothece verrucosa PCC 7822]
MSSQNSQPPFFSQQQEVLKKNIFKKASRRQILGGLSIGFVAAQVAPAVAQQSSTLANRQETTSQEIPNQSMKQNPVNQYPSPPFPRQPQKPPGLASEMTPRPDHGETSYEGTGRLIGRKALITGGDSGIGRAAAIAFAREGADVAINYLPVEEPDAREVIQLIESAGRKAIAIPGDIREESFCNQLVATAVRELGGLDILVNNAGKQQSVDSIKDLTTEQFDSTFKTNVYAMFWITKAAMSHLKPGASIINTSSVQAYDPSANLLDYSQTKSAIVAFTKSLAKQLAQQGIRVNAVAPGPYWTPLQVSGGQPQSKIEQFGSDSPMGRPGQPAELAPIYVLLASSESSYATGQVYGAAGGSGNP